MRSQWTKKKLLRLTLPCIAFLALAGMCVYTVFIKPNRNQETVIYMETVVRMGDLIQGIEENGSVEMEESHIEYTLDINYDEDEEDDEDDGESSRYLTIGEVYVVQGQRIEEGEPLFWFTQESIDAVRRKLEKARSEAQVELAEAQSSYNTSLQAARSTYSTSKAESDTASRTYDAAVNTLEQNISLLYGDIQVLQAEINDYNEKLTDEDTLEEYSDLKYALELAEKKLTETDPSVVEAYTANYASYQSAKEAFEALDDRLQGYRDGIEENLASIEEKNQEILEAQESLGEKEMQARQKYDSAVQNGSLAPEIYSYTETSLASSVEEARQEVEDAGELLAELEAFVGTDGIVYADGSGLVTQVLYEEGDRLIRSGVMLSYAKEDAYSVTIDVSEEDIPYISVGDNVEVSISAYPDEVYEGLVSAITTSAADSYSSTVNYPVTIRILGDTSRLYGGMTADITFVTDRVENVLYVSARAIVTDADGDTAVYVDGEDGEKVQKKVTTGFSNGSGVEIVEGLEEGDVIYIASTVSAGQDVDSLQQTGEEGTGPEGPDGTGDPGRDTEGTETEGGPREGGGMPQDAGGSPGGFPSGMEGGPMPRAGE